MWSLLGMPCQAKQLKAVLDPQAQRLKGFWDCHQHTVWSKVEPFVIVFDELCDLIRAGSPWRISNPILLRFCVISSCFNFLSFLHVGQVIHQRPTLLPLACSMGRPRARWSSALTMLRRSSKKPSAMNSGSPKVLASGLWTPRVVEWQWVAICRPAITKWCRSMHDVL